MTDMDPTEISIEPEPTPAAKPRARSIALVVGIVAVLGGAIFAGLSLADDANAPEDPVRAMFEAAEQGDVLGVLEELEPGERDALRDPIADLVSELNRLEILDADVRDLSGIELEVTDLELASDGVSDDIAAVTITGGQGRYRFEPSELPLGNFLRDLIGDGLDEAEAESGEDSLASDDDTFVATVRRDGRWYVSIGYTVAENARRDAGVAFDEMGEGIEANGADSPEAAVRGLVEASTALDLRRVIELLPPGELGALQEYAGLFIDEAEDAAEEVRGQFEVEVPTLELDSETNGDRATVFIRDAEFRASFGDEGGVAYEDGCFSMDIAGQEPQEVCETDDPSAFLEDGLFGGLEDLGGLGDLGLGEIEPPNLSFEGDLPAYGIATVQVDGKWYVSPTRTVLDDLVETARIFQPADLREIRRYVEEVFGAFQETMTSGFGFGYDEEDRLDGETTYGTTDEMACMMEAETEEEYEACFGEAAVPTTTIPAD